MNDIEEESFFSIDGTEYPCRWVRSSRARYLRLRVSAEGEIRITMPVFTSHASAERFLQEQIPWLRRSLLKMKEYRQMKTARKEQTGFFPDTMELPFLGQSFRVEYVWHDASWLGVKADRRNGIIFFTGNVLDPDLVYPAFSSLLKRMASEEFPAMLKELSIRLQIPYSRCSIRLQSKRWGSCSNRGSISLNAMLLFFPKEIVEYVMVHELCHRIHMDHSDEFWALVSRYVPDWKILRARLNRDADRLPVALTGIK